MRSLAKATLRQQDEMKITISEKAVLFEDGFREARSGRTVILSIEDILANRSALFGKDYRVNDVWSGTLVGYAPGFSAFGQRFSFLNPGSGKRWSVAIPQEHRGRQFLSFYIHPMEYSLLESADAVEVVARNMRFEELAAFFPFKINGTAETGRYPISSIIANFRGDIRRIFEIFKASPPWAHLIRMKSGVEISQLNADEGYFGPMSFSRSPGYESGLMLMDHTLRSGAFQKKYFAVNSAGHQR